MMLIDPLITSMILYSIGTDSINIHHIRDSQSQQVAGNLIIYCTIVSYYSYIITVNNLSGYRDIIKLGGLLPCAHWDLSWYYLVEDALLPVISGSRNTPSLISSELF